MCQWMGGLAATGWQPVSDSLSSLQSHANAFILRFFKMRSSLYYCEPLVFFHPLCGWSLIGQGQTIIYP